MLLPVLAISCLIGAVLVIGEVMTAGGRERMRSIRFAAGYGRRLYSDAGTRQSFGERVVVPLRKRFAALALRLSPKTTIDSVRLRLLAAGLGQRLSPYGFLAWKVPLAAIGLVCGAVLGASTKGGAATLLFGLGFAGAGYVVPDIFLTLRTRRRRETVRAHLPNSLDLLAVTVEAGLGFDAAIMKLNDEIGGPLAEEFGFVLREMRLGESRENALKHFADRVDAPEVSSFVRGMVQADQLGMSIGRILRVQASEARLKRQAAAEERAMKAPVKMLIPTVLFIFPAMFIVILGPAFIQLFDLF